MSRGTLLRGGRIVDPSLNQDGRADVRFREGIVTAIGLLDPEPGEHVIDGDGLVVAPGLIDVHVHLREPGQEWKETVGTGTDAAAAGGFTTIFCMPNTEPALDSVVALEELARRRARDAVVRVRPVAAISEGRRGIRAVDYDALAAGGAVGFSDDGDSTKSSGVMTAALRATRRTGRPVMVHCEDPGLVGGAMHEGDISHELGLPGIAPEAEEIIIARDLQLAAATGGWLHVCHVSTRRGAELVGKAKRAGVNVTAEVMPHHLVMTDAWVGGCREWAGDCGPRSSSGVRGDPETKVNPPLRAADDARHLLAGLKSAQLDILATDHAPHAMPEKQGRPFASAAFGINGSEFALPTMMVLVSAGRLTLGSVISLFSTVPARLWGLDAGTLRPGSAADIIVFDPDEEWNVHPSLLRSRSANSPLTGTTLKGKVKRTFVGGDERYRG